LTTRARSLAAVLCTLTMMLAPSLGAAASNSFKVTSTVDGKKLLPHRIHWLGRPTLPQGRSIPTGEGHINYIDWTPGPSSFQVHGPVTLKMQGPTDRVGGWLGEPNGPIAGYGWSVSGDTPTRGRPQRARTHAPSEDSSGPDSGRRPSSRGERAGPARCPGSPRNGAMRDVDAI
jgi:hypothetical protein